MIHCSIEVPLVLSSVVYFILCFQVNELTDPRCTSPTDQQYDQVCCLFISDLKNSRFYIDCSFGIVLDFSF